MLVCLSLIPSAHNAWRLRDQPHLGRHDDGFYFTAAQSLARGEYRIESLPGRPYQTKYPPLYPLYLSVVWRIQPEAPANLPLATLFAWLPLPVFVALAWRLFRRFGFGVAAATALACLVALNPYTLILSSTLMSEIFFGCFLLAVVLLVDGEARRRRLLAAGLLAALAYLTRSAALPLLAAAPIALLFREGWKRAAPRAAVFLAPLVLAALSWQLWASAHRTADRFPYETDYFGYFLANVGADNFLPMLWQNLGALLMATYGLFFYEPAPVAIVHLILRFVAFAAVAGIVRLGRRQGWSVYSLFAAGSAVLLTVWNFPPTERFLYPLFPLLLAGLAAEVVHLGSALRAALVKPKLAERAIAAGLLASIAALGVYMTVRTASAIATHLPGVAAEEIKWAQTRRAAYAWAAAHLKDTSGFLAYRDTEFYLFTGLPANRVEVPTRLRYGGKRQPVVDAFADSPAYAQREGLTHAFFTTADFDAELFPEERGGAVARLLASPLVIPIYQDKGAYVFGVREAPSQRAAVR